MLNLKNKMAVYAALTILCVLIAIFAILDYRMAFNTDTYIHSLLMPEIMLSEGKILLDDFPYSNGDNRAIAIALVHMVPTAVFNDNPWLAYFIGSLFLSALYVLTVARTGMKLKTPVILMAPLLLYVSISPSYRFYEHIHGQSSYVIEQMIILIVLSAMAFFLTSKPGQNKRVWAVYGLAGFCIILAGATGLNRTLVSLYAPIIFAFVGCRVLLLRPEPITKRDLKAAALTLIAMAAGALAFKIIASQINYTYGAARPFSLSNWRGQTETFGQMIAALKSLLSLWEPSGSRLSLIRDFAGLIIAGYIIVKSGLALWRRESALQLLAVLFLIGVTATLAAAFNLADIKPVGRYMFPIFAGAIFALMIFTATAPKIERRVVAACMALLVVWSIGAAYSRHQYFRTSETLHANIQTILDKSETQFGIAALAGAGMRNLASGIGSFIPVQMLNDGNLRTLPFHSEYYYRDFKPAKRTALIYVMSQSQGITREDLDNFLVLNGFKLIQDETVKQGRDVVRVMIVDGDLRTVFPGSAAISTPARRFVSEKSRQKGGEVTAGQTCKTRIDVPKNTPVFQHIDSGFMVFPGTYAYRPVFDETAPEDGTLLVSLTTGTEGQVYRDRWSEDEAKFTITRPGVLRIMLFGKNLSSFQYCGAEIRRLSEAD